MFNRNVSKHVYHYIHTCILKSEELLNECISSNACLCVYVRGMGLEPSYLYENCVIGMSSSI